MAIVRKYYDPDADPDAPMTVETAEDQRLKEERMAVIIAKRKAEDDDFNRKLEERRASLSKQNKSNKPSQNQNPGPTPTGQALLNAPSGMDKLKKVLAQPKK
jgi:hypothetical protein